MTILDHAARVLATLARYRDGAGMMELAQATGLPRSTVSRLLQQMQAAGFLTRDTESQRYRPGLLVFEAGRHYRAGEPLLDAAEHAVAELARRTGHSAGVSVLAGRDVMAVRTRVGTQPLRVVLPPGERSPAIATSTGRALLARLDEAAIKALLDPYPEPPSARAPSDLATLLDRIRHVRRRGYEEAVDEVFVGLAAVAVALGDPATGEAVALFVAFSALHVPPAQRRTLATLLTHEAARLGRTFGDPHWAQASMQSGA